MVFSILSPEPSPTALFRNLQVGLSLLLGAVSPYISWQGQILPRQSHLNSDLQVRQCSSRCRLCYDL